MNVIGPVLCKRVTPRLDDVQEDEGYGEGMQVVDFVLRIWLVVDPVRET